MKRRRGPGETNHSVAHVARLLQTTPAGVRKLISEGKLEWTQERDGGPIKVNARSLADYMGFTSKPAGEQRGSPGSPGEPVATPSARWSFLDPPPTVTLDIPVSDQWLIAAMATAVARRIVEVDEPRERRAIWVQILWSLQRLPIVEGGTSWQISGGQGEDSFLLDLSFEGLSYARLDTDTTVISLEYSQGGHRVTRMYDELTGRDREEALRFQMQSFAEELVNPSTEVDVESFGTPLQDDSAPVNLR